MCGGIMLHTDGAVTINPGGSGGWAFVATFPDGKVMSQSGGMNKTTNNRMEMLAIIKGLEAIEPYQIITVYSDAKIVVTPMQGGFPRQWRLDGWRRKGGQIANQDLWRRLLDAVDRHALVNWEWVKGHSDCQLNSECDRLAREASRNGPWPTDAKYEQQVATMFD